VRQCRLELGLRRGSDRWTASAARSCGLPRSSGMRRSGRPADRLKVNKQTIKLETD
jgi:hypothetical protein